MSEIDVPVVRVAFFVVQDKARIAMLKGLSELTAMPAHWPGAMMGLQCDLGSVELARDPEKINRSLCGLVEPAPINIENRQIGDRWGAGRTLDRLSKTAIRLSATEQKLIAFSQFARK